ncbi:unnamed protein product [[Candida] boidinii]|uniref:Unnamed protein product n=1 Tax=Candida boidinii TaxID=5477 RepID=A0A9W6SXI7_CANBO|nr:unnamed protein product [[Candida] boidinii]GMF21998.1 unnamed protein product [[Candida] boidinii]GMF99279.1 unnamed protein product [[Candida] boidinii]
MNQLKYSNMKKRDIIPSSGPKSVLPMESAYLKELDEQRKDKIRLKESKQEKLDIVDYNVNLFDEIDNFHRNAHQNYDQEDEDDDEENDEEDEDSRNKILKAIEVLVKKQFDSNFPIEKGGITKSMRDKIIQKRSNYPKIVIVSQLYSLFPNNETFVDKQIQNLVKRRVLKNFSVNSTGGLDNNFVILASDYIDSVSTKIKLLNDLTESDMIKTLNNFIKFLKNNPSAMDIKLEELRKASLNEVHLVSMGFLTLSTLMRTSSEDRYYKLSIPNIGHVLKLTKDSVTWILKQLNGMKFREMLETKLIEKYDTRNNKWVKFNGLNLYWSLSICLGNGFAESFNTPAGRGWKSTGKKL